MRKKESASKQVADLRIFEMQARICKAFGNPIRLYVLNQLGKRPRSVSELQKMLERSVPNICQHLSILRDAGVIRTRRAGKRVYCSLPIPEIKQACDLIHNMVRHQVKNSNNLVTRARY